MLLIKFSHSTRSQIKLYFPPMESSEPSTSQNAEQLAIIERKRQRALLTKQKNQNKLTTEEVFRLEKYNELNLTNNHDTGGGFFLDSDTKDKQQLPLVPSSSTDSDKPVILLDTRENECDECNDNFSNSFLLSNYGETICDNCKDLKITHKLITRTEAKNEYLLSDVDLDKREPPLKFILKKNPREYARSYMKLYLKLQVEERALEVWESEEKLEEERQKRVGKREDRKRKQFSKQMKDLRMSARSSYYEKRLNRGHEHEYGPEKPFDDPEDPGGEYYIQTCKTCGIDTKFEKM